MSSICDLPPELLLNIATQLRHHDLSHLVCVSKRFHALVERLIWRDIELHACHKSPSKQRLCMLPLEPRDPGAMDSLRKSDEDAAWTTGKFLCTCNNLRTKNCKRWRRLAPTVRSLCLTVDGLGNHEWGPAGYMRGIEDNTLNAWNVLLEFPNIERLEVIATDWSQYDNPDSDWIPIYNPGAALSTIKHLRLRGYIPAQWLDTIRATNIEWLDYGVLDLPEGRLEEEDSQANFKEWMDQLQLLAPRPMLWKNSSITSPINLSALTHLCLCRPVETDEPDENWPEYSFKYDNDRDSLTVSEWVTLLRGVQHTIVDLTLDQRHIVNGIQPDTILSRPPTTSTPKAERKFKEIILPVLLEYEWPALRRLEFRGIVVDRDDDSNVKERLRRKHPKIEIVYSGGDHILYSTGADGTMLLQDDNDDGLLPVFQYHEDDEVTEA